MADLKEETTLDNTENQVEETVETKKTINPDLTGVQLFYEKNKQTVNYVGGGLAVLIANEIFWAENYFEKDSFNVALKGGVMVMAADGQKQMMGFEQVAEEYGMTKSGNLANYYAGICNLRTGKYEQAIEFLSKYDGNDEIVAPIAIGAIGDCNMELNKMDEAVKYYLKAADRSNNNFTTPYFLKKAGFAYEQSANYAEALKAYERISKEFASSDEGREIEKHIAKVKALGNL